jgi:hypothetical protein
LTFLPRDSLTSIFSPGDILTLPRLGETINLQSAMQEHGLGCHKRPQAVSGRALALQEGVVHVLVVVCLNECHRFESFVGQIVLGRSQCFELSFRLGLIGWWNEITVCEGTVLLYMYSNIL